ncbi:MAG: NAD(P)(+) transhydrogenase (Re/Si-specific) subunit beta, partial [Rhodothermales bacterium]|nr:NAD(P)(+) transhydrogenase (Re/Si-specific) subunit beta [Rhodothermales bacterium]
MKYDVIQVAYLVAAALFIFGLKRLQSPATARGGNQLAAAGMLVAVVATLFLQEILTPVEMLIGLVVGGLVGVVLARTVQMTSMPELVAAFNGFGGLASALVAGAEVMKEVPAGMQASAVPAALQAQQAGLDAATTFTILLSVLIGTVTFSGSFVAFGKLSGRVSGNPVSFPGMRVLTILVAAAGLAAMGWALLGTDAFMLDPQPVVWGVAALGLLALVLGILLVIPIGGADMPVVVALLNSYSGLAAAATGFVLDNVALIVSGALVGASGLILTKIMCDAMNRSLLNVLLGGFGGDAGGDGAAVAGLPEGLTVNTTSPDDTAILLSYADKAIIVPGYGLAVAQAQHQVRELADLLQANGVTVKYAIHPVAGRMPGHMNVLLAEANVPYDQLYEMDDINGEFDTCDVVLVIGANDVVNPAARHDTNSPIYGMPILNVDKAQTVIVLKRSMRPG